MTQPHRLTEGQGELRGVIAQAALEELAWVTQKLDRRRLSGWETFLLETLESRRPDEIEIVLHDVKDAIETRLEVGQW